MERSRKISSRSTYPAEKKISLLVPCENFTTNVPLILIGNKAKLPTLASVRLLLEIVETFLNENKQTTQDEYELRFPSYFIFSDESPITPRPKNPHTLAIDL